MKNLCRLLTALCLIAAVSSCKQKTDYSIEISRLDSAALLLSETEKEFLALDTSALRASHNAVKEKIDRISEQISGDTVQKKLAIFLSDSYEQAGNISTLLGTKNYFVQAITEGRQRISDLKHDLKEDLIEKNKSQEYVVNEMNASQKISEAVNSAIVKAKASSMKLDSLKTEISALADSLSIK